MPYEVTRFGERQSAPAESANRWVNQQGDVLLEHENGRLRSESDLIGEFRRKTLLFLYPDPDRPFGTMLLGSSPKVVSRWPWKQPYGREGATQTNDVVDIANRQMALQVLRSGIAFPVPDGRRLQYTEADFRHAFQASPYEVDRLLERESKGMSLILGGGRGGSGSSISAAELEEIDREEQKKGKGWVALAKIGLHSAPVIVAASACAPVQEMPTATQVAPTRTPTATRMPESTSTPFPGGPDDERILSPSQPWPTLKEVPALRSNGGPFTFDVAAPNVQAQLEAVKRLIIGAGWMIVSAPDRLTSGKTVYIAPFQDQDQWSIQAITSDGIMVPIRRDGVIMDRPDWATRDVDRYEEREHGLGTGFSTRYELVYDHWVAVVRSDEGERVGTFDLFADDWVFDLQEVAEEQVEVLEDDPNDPTTWPAEYRAYYDAPGRSVGQRVEFWADAFMMESRRGLLLNLAKSDRALLDRIFTHLRDDGLLRTRGSNTVEIVREMSDWELFWANLIHNAEIQQETILTPNDIRGIVVNRDAVVINWIESLPGGEYIPHGMYGDWIRDPNTPMAKHFLSVTYEMDVFGKTVTVPRFPSHVYMGGRLAGIVDLPGNAGTGMLIAFKDRSGGWHLQIFHVVNPSEEVRFDETMELCVGGVNNVYGLAAAKILCPRTSVHTEFRVGDQHQSARLRQPLSTDWLSWPGHPVKMVMFASSYPHQTYQSTATVYAFHHPDSGLEIARDVVMAPPWP